MELADCSSAILPSLLDELNKVPVIVHEADKSELMFKTVKGDEEAYDLYNEYAFQKGFSIRKAKTRSSRSTGEWTMRKFFCSNAGFKDNKNKSTRKYEKTVDRTGCTAYVQFSIGKDGVWTFNRHNMIHNHEMIPPDKRHLLRSQRKVTADQVKFMSNIKNSGIRVSNILRVIRNEVGGSPNMGFTAPDAYNSLSSIKASKLEGGDCNQLMKYFARRQARESDFFYEFEVDDFGSLCNIFWRDGRMKRDYEFFGDLLVFDTTYRTNKYDMICAPFVGMNHHCSNVMFGMGFVVNESTSSFVWLFESFMRSVGGKHPITVMTDQALGMAAAIRNVFPQSTHRLCTWHLGENSITNIGHLRALKGFRDTFNYLLKYYETVDEFEHYWPRMMEKYKCEDNDWLKDLYEKKERWCPAYSKDYFSGGILSSQRSESTNNSVSHRLRKTDGLCDFYHTFLDVISDWRSKEKGLDFRFLKGNRHLAVANVPILVHAREIYTIQIYVLFEEQFAKGIACNQEQTLASYPFITYLVWRPAIDLIRHEVKFNKDTHSVQCTCKYFSEIGLLCAHSLRIYNVHCVCKIPEQYILKRWTKSAMCSQPIDEKYMQSNVVAASIWRAQTLRKFVRLVTSCQDCVQARVQIDMAFDSLKETVEYMIGDIDFNNLDDDISSEDDFNVKNPRTKRKKGGRNERPKSTVEKECNKAKEWKKRTEQYTEMVRFNVQTSVQDFDKTGAPLIYSNSSIEGSRLVVLNKAISQSNEGIKFQKDNVDDGNATLSKDATQDKNNKHFKAGGGRDAYFNEILSKFDQ